MDKKKTTEDPLNIVIGAIKDFITNKPEIDEDFLYEDELSVLGRDYPWLFDKRKAELIESNKILFQDRARLR